MLRLKIVNQIFGTVGLDDTETEGVDEIAVMGIGVFVCFVIFMSAAESVPETVDPKERLALCERRSLLDIGIIGAPAQFESAWVACEVGSEGLHGSGIVHIDDGHINDLIEVLPIESPHFVSRFASFHDDLAGRAGLLKERYNEVEVAIGFIEVDEHAVFTEEQHFAEGRYLMAGLDGNAVLEPESADGVECHFGDDSFAGSGAVQFGIMHDDELAVRSTLQIEFDNIHAHRDSRLNGRDGVLGPSSPIGTVGCHEHTWTVGVKQVGTNLFGTG